MRPPKATPIELKFCIAALAHTDGFNKSSHFGIKKYLIPSIEPSRVTPLINIITITTYGKRALINKRKLNKLFRKKQKLNKSQSLSKSIKFILLNSVARKL